MATHLTRRVPRAKSRSISRTQAPTSKGMYFQLEGSFECKLPPFQPTKCSGRKKMGHNGQETQSPETPLMRIPYSSQRAEDSQFSFSTSPFSWFVSQSRCFFPEPQHNLQPSHKPTGMGRAVASECPYTLTISGDASAAPPPTLQGRSPEHPRTAQSPCSSRCTEVTGCLRAGRPDPLTLANLTPDLNRDT